jgi:outer membrane murein-binding lipoprotein Lpp
LCFAQEELDRRELHVQTLTAQNEDLGATVETLKAELMASHAESERTARELDLVRNRDLSESVASAHALRETLAELERSRLGRDEWEREAMQERLAVEEARGIAEALRRELDVERETRVRDKGELNTARETAANLQSVLEDFQTGACACLVCMVVARGRVDLD